MTLTSTQGPLDAVVAVLTAHLPSPWVVTDEPSLDTNTVLVEPVTSPTPTAPTMGGRHEVSSVLVQLTGRATTRRKACLAADACRDILTGQAHRKPLHPLDLTGYHFDHVEGLGDVRLVLDKGIHHFTETYRITWQYTPVEGS